MNELDAHLLVDVKGRLSESPQWSSAEGALYWVDIENGLLHRFDWRTTCHECVSLPAPVTMVTPGPRPLVTSGNSLLRLDWKTRASQRIASLPLDPSRVRFNDGKLDPQGRLWLGTMAIDEHSPVAGLYRLVGQTLEQVLTDVTVSNGIVWHGQTMYYADSGAGTLDAFDFDGASGELERRRNLVRYEGAAFADGLWVDDEGCLWVAMWGGGEVRRYAPDGGLLDTWPLPVSQPSACCFVGPGRDILLVTSARFELSAEALAREPAAGRVMAIDPGVTGPAATPYRPRPGVLPS